MVAPRAVLFSVVCILGMSIGSVSFAEQRPDGVADYLARCEAFGWSGVGLVVKNGEVLLHEGYGYADVEQQRQHGSDTLFEIASLTKPFTACAIMALVEDNKVDLDSSIAEYLPGVPDDKRRITVRQLLAHTSGMPRSSTGGRGNDLEKAVASYLGVPLERNPGESSAYWNGGYALLAGIVQQASGQSYPDYCRQRLFQAADLQTTGFTGDTHLPIEQQAMGYVGAEPIRRSAEHPYGAYGWQYQGMGGIVTSTNDFQRFLEAYGRGKVLQPETITLMETPETEFQGLGWSITTTKRGTRRVGHGGDVRGFHCQLQRFPDEECYVLLLSNVDEIPMWKLAWNVESLLFDQPLRTPTPPPVRRLPTNKLARLAGDFESETGKRLTVEIVGGRAQLHTQSLHDDPRAEMTALAEQADSAFSVAKQLLELIRTGETDALRAKIGPGIPPTWSMTLCQIIWPKHVSQHGDPEAGAVLLDAQKSHGSDDLILGLQHGDRLHPLRMMIRDGKLRIFDLSAKRPPPSVVYGVSLDNELVGFDWATDESSGPIKLGFADGRAVSLKVAGIRLDRVN